MSWFESWFDTKYYHILYKNRDFQEAKNFILKLVQHLELKNDVKILDLACGKGRHSLELNHLGFSVTGIDLSQQSIKSAKIFENEKLKFYVGDMRTVHFENTFDAIFNLFTSFGYFETEQENFSVFDAVYKQLKNEGIFVFDYLNEKFVKNTFIEFEEKNIDNLIFKIHKKIENDLVIKEIKFEDEGKSYQFFEKVRLFDFKKINSQLKNKNFKVISTFGTYNLDEYSENSPRMIIIAKKTTNAK